MADTDDNMMKQFAPALIGVGLLASTFWLGGVYRRLPSEFSGLRVRRTLTHRVRPGTSIRIYDAGPSELERYTVVVSGKKWQQGVRPGYKPFLGMSEGGRAVSEWGETHKNDRLGKPVAWEDLSAASQRHILARLEG